MLRINKRGSVEDVLYVGVIIFVLAIVYFIGFFITGTVKTEMLANPIINASAPTYEVLDTSLSLNSRFDMISLYLFIGFALSLIISAWFIDTHPVFIIVSLLVAVIGVAVAGVLSSVWTQISTSSVFGSQINSFPITNHLMSNWPMYIAVIFLLAIFVTFGKPLMSGGGQ